MWLTKKSYYFCLSFQTRADKIFRSSCISHTAQWSECEQLYVSGVCVSKHEKAETGRSTGLWWIARFILRVPQRRVKHEDSFEYELPACWSDLSGKPERDSRTWIPTHASWIRTRTWLLMPVKRSGKLLKCTLEGSLQASTPGARERCFQSILTHRGGGKEKGQESEDFNQSRLKKKSKEYVLA